MISVGVNEPVRFDNYRLLCHDAGVKIFLACLFIAIMMFFPAPVRTPAPPAVDQVEPTPALETLEPVKVETPKPLSKSFLIESVPFIPQTPLKKWDALHEDACEEASLLTLRYWVEGRQPDVTEIERELQGFIAWQVAHDFGPSITLTQLKRAASQYWVKSWWSEIKVGQSATLDDLRRELAAGNPVVIGAAGRELKNPHFKNGGPNYHMLVLIGYDEDGFVTNDPGTQFGASYRYTIEIIEAAWHDWNAQNILSGTRNYLVIK
jgi:hypothetical protein